MLLLVSVLNVSANKTYDCHINFFFERENDREKERERERKRERESDCCMCPVNLRFCLRRT